jgi:tRNA-specific 2-thiouridylase
MPRERILVAMSGGVDSSVAALLLKQQGCDIVGAYMKNWINEDNVVGHCPWLQDIDDARAVADRLGIEFRVVNLMRDYRRLVVDYLLDGYQRGLTPNPDVMCNREVKFGVFLAYAKAEGFAAVATGHYARRCSSISTSTKSGGMETAAHPANFIGGARPQDALVPAGLAQVNASSSHVSPSYALLEGSDPNKDQSYFLALLSQAQLRDARFPIGHLKKPDLRRLAAEAGLATAAKKDSQGICFIGEVKMADFLKAYVPEHPGPIIRATDGRELGAHRGLHYFTIGQRRGIRIPSNTDHEAYVVVGKRASDHALLVAFDGPTAPGLWTNEGRVHNLSFIGEPLTTRCRVECRVRYRDPRVPIDFIPELERVVDGLPSLGDGGPNEPGSSALIKFGAPQRALASGQILALYDGERLLGGGVFA